MADELKPAAEVEMEALKAMREMVAPYATDGELKLYVEWCRARGFDPTGGHVLIRQWKKGDKPSFIVTIEGLRARAQASGRYGGCRVVLTLDDNGFPFSAQGIVKVQAPNGREWIEDPGWTVFYRESVAKDKEGNPNVFWAQRPAQMLQKNAEAAALRKTFPQELSGAYLDEEVPETKPPSIEETLASLVGLSGPQKADLVWRSARALGIEMEAAQNGAPRLSRLSEADRDRLAGEVWNQAQNIQAAIEQVEVYDEEG